ncbi:MAG: ABC transporter permease [Peptococcaceae bacterium]|nr:ABC transporter permease [Peptococcaceae bacterium]
MIKTWNELPLRIKVCVVLLCVVLFTVLFADFLMPYDPDKTDLLHKTLSPAFMGGNAEHILGTDELGRDVLSRVMYGARISIGIALFGLLIGCGFGLILGLTAGYFGGWWDRVALMLINFQQSIPFILFVLVGLVIFGRSIPVLIVLMGIARWETYAKITRGLVLSLKKKQYVEAAKCYNASPLRILARYIFPGVRTYLIVLITLNFPLILLVETSLSFVGIGVQPPTATLGQMVGTGKNYLVMAPWISIAPAIMIVVVAYCIQHIGEHMRERFDVRLLEK